MIDFLHTFKIGLYRAKYNLNLHDFLSSLLNFDPAQPLFPRPCLLVIVAYGLYRQIFF